MPIYDLGAQKPRLAEGVFVAPDANIIGDVVLHEGASVVGLAPYRPSPC